MHLLARDVVSHVYLARGSPTKDQMTETERGDNSSKGGGNCYKRKQALL